MSLPPIPPTFSSGGTAPPPPPLLAAPDPNAPPPPPRPAALIFLNLWALYLLPLPVPDLPKEEEDEWSGSRGTGGSWNPNPLLRELDRWKMAQEALSPEEAEFQAQMAILLFSMLGGDGGGMAPRGGGMAPRGGGVRGTPGAAATPPTGLLGPTGRPIAPASPVPRILGPNGEPVNTPPGPGRGILGPYGRPVQSARVLLLRRAFLVKSQHRHPLAHDASRFQALRVMLPRPSTADSFLGMRLIECKGVASHRR